MTVQGITNALVLSESGGGDMIYLKNESGATISQGDKVLFTMGTTGSSTPTTFSHTRDDTNFLFNPIGFLDSSAFVTSFNSTGYLHTLANGTWSSGAANSMYAQWGGYGTYQYFSDGTIAYFGRRESYTLSGLVSLSGRVQIGNYNNTYMYVGTYNGTTYITTSGCIYSWNRTANTVNLFLNPEIGEATSATQGFARVFGSKCIYQGNSNNQCKMYSITAAESFTQLSLFTLAGRILFATGLEQGDYVFVTDNYAAYNNHITTPQTAHLICYQMQSDNTLKQVTVPALSLFETTNCFFAYDNRNNVLSVGTEDNVYFYQFDTLGKTFSIIDVALSSLPTTLTGFAYKTMMSPDKSTVVVYAKGSTACNVNVYSLSTSYNRIVPNSAYYYNLTTSFTGFATGETDSSGNYEISTVLPSVVDVEIKVNVEPDEITVIGGAE